VDHMHQLGIGVLLDWVPGHFPKDEHGLARFDGSALFEHEHPFLGEHTEWGTYIFNYGRAEVKGFLISNAIYWIDEFHIDGLRVDAVASMLYLNYARKDGEWIPNKYGGVENLEAVDFLREMNSAVHEYFPGVWVIAEESTAWPMVSRPVYLGGLGFSMKWNMGWMNDTLYYFEREPVHRKYHHEKLTFSIMYAFTENFVLPLSHDEVVHGKKSILHKMPGDEWQQFANVRLLYTYLFTHPGKKLLFMGSEFAQRQEWDEARGLEWLALNYFPHEGVMRAVADLNQLYRSIPALHFHDFDSQGFEWIDCHDSDQSIISYIRKQDSEFVVVILNFTPVLREHYRIGVPVAGHYQEIFNSDSQHYGGSNQGNAGGVNSQPQPYMGHAQSLALRIPPLAGVVLRLHI
ncbi:MAG TPA: 1,4-alpha-glucan branching enzyme, partial [Pseudomonadales bacterium]|nr:1,4-alpha-glucan branching enzyme [Pseudomonadales bacterium]